VIEKIQRVGKQQRLMIEKTGEKQKREKESERS